ncbi:50S ribosomal protein L25 [Paenibacillus segetis]|uniref:Large ribosomal subunit protein bL25 n=1 Tax=Paenibacillus segetis TaxID=1325360 RepID=A0ABQ1Y5P6_9BACL|nr:50S ribosomal protein L25 [Paenibacillus segetis]GGH13618.1 50S ribosomal protein L25 [Paenibacillus segetis]
MRTCFEAELRQPTNRSGLKSLRREGRLPGVILSANAESTMIHVALKEFQRWTRNGGTGVLELQLEGSETVPVLLEAIQRDPVTRDLIHADFLRVNHKEIVRTWVMVEYVGTPSGTKKGGVLQTQVTMIEVEALPADLPASIAIDISHLEIGESLQVKDLQIPNNVELISSGNEFLVSVVTPRL